MRDQGGRVEEGSEKGRGPVGREYQRTRTTGQGDRQGCTRTDKTQDVCLQDRSKAFAGSVTLEAYTLRSRDRRDRSTPNTLRPGDPDSRGEVPPVASSSPRGILSGPVPGLRTQTERPGVHWGHGTHLHSVSPLLLGPRVGGRETRNVWSRRPPPRLPPVERRDGPEGVNSTGARTDTGGRRTTPTPPRKTRSHHKPLGPEFKVATVKERHTGPGSRKRRDSEPRLDPFYPDSPTSTLSLSGSGTVVNRPSRRHFSNDHSQDQSSSPTLRHRNN